MKRLAFLPLLVFWAVAAFAADYNISWNDVWTGETAIKLQRRTMPAGSYATIYTAPANTTTYLDSGCSGICRYRVTATVGGVDQPYSNEACVPTACSPAAPTGVHVSGQATPTPIALTATASVPPPVTAATYYVSATTNTPPGSDSNPGTELLPWATIYKAMTTAGAGDLVYVRGGTYHEHTNLTYTGVAGTSGYPITIKAYPGETPILNGNGNTGRLRFSGASWIVWDGLEITNYQHLLYIAEVSHDITIQNCRIHGSGLEAVRVTGNSYNVVIQDNTIYDAASLGGGNGEGVYIGTAEPGDNTHHVTVRRNTIYNTLDEGVDLKQGTHDVVIEHNTFYNTTTDPTWSAQWGTIEISEVEGSYAGNPNHIVRNNTFHDTKTAIRAGTGSQVYNNVIYSIASPYYGIYIDNADGDSYTRYIYHNTVDLPDSRAIIRSAGTVDVQNNIGPSTTRFTANRNLLASDAYYVAKASGDFRVLKGQAPHTTTSTDLRGTVATDKEGMTRLDSTPSYGAYERAVVMAAGCTNAQVTSAIGTAANGDTVQLPACASTTWSSAVTISGKGITLAGAGVGQTTVLNGTSGRMLAITLNPAYATTIVRGITFDNNSKDGGTSSPMIQMYAEGNQLTAFRLHNFEVLRGAGTAIQVNLEGYDVGGVIDSGTINMIAPKAPFTIFGDTNTEPTTGPWSRALSLGTEHAIYVEDMTIDNQYTSGQLDGFNDGYAGARYVFRYSNMIGCPAETGHHGTDSSYNRGVHSFEIYNNTFRVTRSCSASTRALNFRGGTGVVFNNAWTNGSRSYTEMAITTYRARNPSLDECNFPQWGGCCAGSSSWDGNVTNGYPCCDQIGYVFDTNGGAGYALEPLYEWNNTINGANFNFTVQSSVKPGYIVNGRDYYTDTQRPGYTPYTYPHPLRNTPR